MKKTFLVRVRTVLTTKGTSNTSNRFPAVEDVPQREDEEEQEKPVDKQVGDPRQHKHEGNGLQNRGRDGAVFSPIHMPNQAAAARLVSSVTAPRSMAAT